MTTLVKLETASSVRSKQMTTDATTANVSVIIGISSRLSVERRRQMHCCCFHVITTVVRLLLLKLFCSCCSLDFCSRSYSILPRNPRKFVNAPLGGCCCCFIRCSAAKRRASSPCDAAAAAAVITSSLRCSCIVARVVFVC